MGGHPYWYVVPYQPDLQSALDALRAREFAAGRYNPVLPFIEFGEDGPDLEQQPGAAHASIEEALEASEESGTRSILDVNRIGEAPDYGVAAPFDVELLEELFGTRTPTREQMLESMDLFEGIDRGECRFAVIHRDGAPSEVLFVGYSYD